MAFPIMKEGFIFLDNSLSKSAFKERTTINQEYSEKKNKSLGNTDSQNPCLASCLFFFFFSSDKVIEIFLRALTEFSEKTP